MNSLSGWQKMADDRSLLEKARRELLWRHCVRDEKYALRNFWSIKVPGVGRMLFDLREAQVQAIDHWNENRYSLTLKARQIGWSTSVAAHCWHTAFFQPDREILLISKGEREAALLLSKVKYGLAHLPRWMWDRGPTLVTDSKTQVEFSNGSSITSLPSASDPARSFAGYLIVVDEWAFLNDPDSAWASIEPTADVGGRIIGLSTANGHGNFFHTLWVEAETGVNFFKTMFQSWRAGGRDDDWYATKKGALPAWQLAQEYPDNPEEAFLKSGNPVFDLDILWEMGKHIATPKIGMLVESVV